MATYYIKLASEGGSNAANGTSEATAWATLAKAASMSLVGGDIVYVKAGATSYPPEQISWTRSGADGNPIQIIGYKTTPGDQPPIPFDASNPVAALITTDMPTWTMTNGDWETFIDLRGCKNITFKNLQIGGYGVGFRAGISSSVSGYATQHTNLTFFNIACKTMGNGDSYSGIGLNLGDMGTYFVNYSTVTKCLVTNAGAEGISVFGEYNQVTDCKTYVDDVNRIMDYHFLCTGNHNAYLRCIGEVKNDFPALHQNAHGISFKTNAEQRLDHASPLVSMDISAQYNTATDCIMINVGEGFTVRHRTSQYNTFTNCKSYGSATGTSDSDNEGNCITIRDGASDNTFINSYAEGCEVAVRFADTSEDGDTIGSSGLPTGSAPGHPGNNNRIINLVSVNCYIGIDYHYDPGNNDALSDAGTNHFENCSFNGTSYLFFAQRPAANITYKNCVFGGNAATMYQGWIAGDYDNTIVASQFTNCNFWGLTSYPGSSFTSAGTSCHEVDPLFVNAAAKNLRLQSGSPMINAGTSTGITNTEDYDGVARSSGHYSIGAFETNGGSNTPPSVSIISPGNGTGITTGAVITITAAASDTDGTIASVEFFVDGVSVGVDNFSPYTANYTAVTGTHSITATATDNLGGQTTSSAISITVSAPTPPPPHINSFSGVVLNFLRKNYYLSPTGDDTKDGLTLATAWKTIGFVGSYASPVLPGDTVWAKAGDYGYEQVDWFKSGLLGAPINIIGYKNYPGDQPPMLVNNSNPYAIVTSDMPTWTKPGTTGNYFIYASGQQYVNFKNLQCSNYNYGFSIESPTDDLAHDTSITLFNCGIRTIGTADAAVYNGSGIKLGSMGTEFANNCSVIKCLITNVNAEAIFVGGMCNQILDTKIYCNDATRFTDYWIMVNGSYNLVNNCYIERDPSVISDQYTHGIGAKTNAEQVVDNSEPYPVINCYYNKFIDCVTKNIPEGFYVRHRGAQDNLFYNCKSYGNVTYGNGIVIRDGASNNTFDKMLADGCASGVRVFDSVEDGGSTGHANGTNTIKNSVFINNDVAIYFPASVASDAGDIRFYNNTFYKNVKMFSVDRPATLCTYKNCIFEGGVSGGYFVGGANESSIVGSQFTNCNFHDISGGLPGGFVAAGTNCTTADPLFISPTNLRLQSGSTIKNSGITIPEVKTDYDGQTRAVGSYSVGAYER